MGRQVLLDKGIGSGLAGTFAADLAQFWANREERLFEDIEMMGNRSSDYMKAERAFGEVIGALMKMGGEMEKLAFNVENLHVIAKGTLSTLCYRAGYQDGMRMILQSIIG